MTIKERPYWTDKYKHNWDDAYARVMRWWRCEETDRPVIFSSVPKSKEQRNNDLHWISPKNAEEAARFDLDINVKLNNARCSLENTLFPAESAPNTHAAFASLLGLLCVQAGGRLGYDPQYGTAWLLEEPDLYSRPVPDVNAPCEALDVVLTYIKRAHETFGFDIVLGANPMIDPLSTLSMMRGSENFLMDLIDQPEMIKRWAAALGALYRKAVESYRETRAALGRREDMNWTSAWAPGDMDTLESDISVMLSPEMFREFALPEAEYEASFFDYSLWHLDGSGQFKHLDDILAIPGLNGIQYVDEKKRDPLQFADVWKKILARGKSIIFSCDWHYCPALAKELGSKGVAFGCWGLEGEADMERLIREITP